MENSKKQQLDNLKKEEQKRLIKQEKMRCIEIATRFGLSEDRNAETTIAEATKLYNYLNE